MLSLWGAIVVISIVREACRGRNLKVLDKNLKKLLEHLWNKKMRFRMDLLSQRVRKQ